MTSKINIQLESGLVSDLVRMKMNVLNEESLLSCSQGGSSYPHRH